LEETLNDIKLVGKDLCDGLSGISANLERIAVRIVQSSSGDTYTSMLIRDELRAISKTLQAQAALEERMFKMIAETLQQKDPV
jgi:hypothetical protein